MDGRSILNEVHGDKVSRARAMTLDERLTAGATLYAEQSMLVRDLVAGMNSDWTQSEVDAEMKRRRMLVRQSDENDYYSDRRPAAKDLRSGE